MSPSGEYWSEWAVGLKESYAVLITVAKKFGQIQKVKTWNPQKFLPDFTIPQLESSLGKVLNLSNYLIFTEHCV